MFLVWLSNLCLFCWLLWLDGHAFLLAVVFLEPLIWPLIERSPGVKKLLLASPNAFYERCWSTSKDVRLLMKVPRCFLLLDSPFTKQDNKSLAFGHCYLSIGHIPHYWWLLWPHTSCHHQPQISTRFLTLAELSPLAPSLWCPTSIVTHGIYYVSSTWSVALIYKLIFLLHGELGKVKITCSWASCSALFWYICYLARPSCLEHSFNS